MVFRVKPEERDKVALCDQRLNVYAGVLANLRQKAGKCGMVLIQLAKSSMRCLTGGVSHEIVYEISSKGHEVVYVLESRRYLTNESAPLALKLLAYFGDASRTVGHMSAVIVNAGLAVKKLGVVWAGFAETNEAHLFFAAATVPQYLLQLMHLV